MKTPLSTAMAVLGFLLFPYIVSADYEPDAPPDYCSKATIMSMNSGNWSDPMTWSNHQVPGAHTAVMIMPGHVVTYDQISDIVQDVVCVDGTLHFRNDINTRLSVGTLMIDAPGALEIGTPSQPMSPSVKAEIVIADQPVDTNFDPEQFGEGVLLMGNVMIRGTPVTPYMRLGTEPKKGDTTIKFAQAVSGWTPGMRVVIPDTHQLDWFERGQNYTPDRRQWEESTLQSVSPDGMSATLSAALQFDHLGARNGDGVIQALPHLINLSRNVIFRSANPTGMHGHVMAMDQANVDIEYASYVNMGRTTMADLDNTTFDASNNVTHLGTNEIARYPMHFHHCRGPAQPQSNGYQFTWIGCVVDGGTADHNYKWGISIHDSHYGLVQYNVAYNMNGSGFVTEDGSESYNVIANNFAERIKGNGGRADQSDVSNPLGNGREGSGFWFRGPNNYVRNNVAANVYAPYGVTGVYTYGFIYAFYYLGNINTPAFPGADTSDASQVKVVDGNGTPLLECSGNEAYGAMQGGMTIWWLNTVDVTPNPNAVVSVVKNLTVWNFWTYGLFIYPTNKLTIDGLKAFGDFAELATNNAASNGLLFSDYYTKDFVLQNSDIEGTNTGVPMPANTSGIQTVQNCTLRNQTNIAIGDPWSVSYTSNWLGPKTNVIRNVKFLAPTNSPLVGIGMGFTPPYDSSNNPNEANIIVKDQTFVYSYNQQSGQDYQVFYTQQNPTFVVPQSIYNSDQTTKYTASPDMGLTNAQNWAKNNLAVAGAMAPCQDATCSNAVSVAGISGALVFPTSLPPTLSILSPAPGDSVAGTVVSVSYQGFGDLTNVSHAHFSLDGGPDIMDADFDGKLTLTNVPVGSHILNGWLVDAAMTMIAGSSATVSFKTTSASSLAAPTGLIATPGNQQAALSWIANTEANLAGYNVYRAAAQSGSYVKQNTSLVTFPNFTQNGLTNGTAYWYEVSAVSSSGSESAMSIPAAVTPTTVIQPPQILINTPAPGASVTGPNVMVLYTSVGDQSSVSMLHYRLDSGPLEMEMTLDGTIQLIGVAPGSHMLEVYLAKSDDSKIAGTDVMLMFTVVGLGGAPGAGMSMSTPRDVVVNMKTRTMSGSFPSSLQLQFFTRTGKQVLELGDPQIKDFERFPSGILLYRVKGSAPGMAEAKCVIVK